MRQRKWRFWHPESGMLSSDSYRAAELWPVLFADPETIGDWVVMDFTGLQDADGKDIYEGDILTLDYEDIQRAVVVWDEGEAMFAIDPDNDRSPRIGLNELSFDLVKVIGNAHEHPHLLENADATD